MEHVITNIAKRKLHIGELGKRKGKKKHYEELIAQKQPVALWRILVENGVFGIEFELYNMTQDEIEKLDDSFAELNEIIANYVKNNPMLFYPQYERSLWTENLKSVKGLKATLALWKIESTNGKYGIWFTRHKMLKVDKIELDKNHTELKELILDFQWNNKKLFGDTQRRLFEVSRKK